MFRQIFIVAVFILCICCRPAAGKQQPVIITARQCSHAEALAAKEIRRYVYLRTGELLSIAKSDGDIADISFIAVTEKGRDIVRKLTAADEKVKATVTGLKPQEYLIKTAGAGNTKAVWIVGGDSAGVLYGTYRFIEHFGVRFYLYGDVIPDEKINFTLPEIDEAGKPLFELRGILPFHDFPEGPDWWDSDDYKAVLEQTAKMRMNFIGLHTYPEKEPNSQLGNTEPAVWIGLADDVGEKGNVKFSYPSRHFNTLNNDWGYIGQKTSDYYFGASEIFEQDDFGANYMEGLTPCPKSAEQCNELFNRFSNVLNDVFSYAHKLGIKTCVGTEVPLTIPAAVRQKLKAMGKNPCDTAVVREVYEGMFERIKRAYPIDYYWLWTPEDWMWKGADEKQVKAVVSDFEAAIGAAEKIKAPFALATCGWVLGPQNDRALFDNTLPKNMPISCIGKDVGFAFVEPGFAKITGRPKWSIPWLEDDPALTVPQLWAGRMRRDALDSLSYGCSGLMGIHWRTRIIGPNIAALAQAGWKQDFAKGAISDPNKIANDPNNVARDLPAEDFYADWAIAEFGPTVAEPMGKLFSKLDGGPFSNVIGQRKTNLPRPATWVDGPGGIKADEREWREVEKSYSFVGEMERLRQRVKGKGYLERFDYWLNNFRYLREVGQLRCVYGRYNKEAAKVTSIKDANSRRQFVSETLLPIRREMIEQLAKVHRYLLQTVNTKGEMGNVTNWQQHVIPELLTEPSRELAKISGEELLANKWPTRVYEGKARIFVPTVRGQLTAGEDLRIKAIVLDRQKCEEVTLYYSKMGTNEFREKELSNIDRGVYAVKLPAGEIGEDMEYYIKATTTKGEKLYFPATAPRINQTVIVVEAGE